MSNTSIDKDLMDSIHKLVSQKMGGLVEAKFVRGESLVPVSGKVIDADD